MIDIVAFTITAAASLLKVTSEWLRYVGNESSPNKTAYSWKQLIINLHASHNVIKNCLFNVTGQIYI